MVSIKEAQDLLENLENLNKLAKDNPGMINVEALSRAMDEASKIARQPASEYSEESTDFTSLKSEKKPSRKALQGY
ncbi:hypothetical protein GF325_08955 [Candidatus Bathyarchaeota archaeon]|nr:hypothetical protein [Candidatus Bathyarchaeota archaeon]